jgi:hypothetical protein
VPDRHIVARAAARTGVPPALLLAISYVQSRWRDHGGRPSIDGGYGLMDLGQNPEHDTLDAAARLLGVPPGRVAHEDALNVLGGARLLARAARARTPHHRLPLTLGGWVPAVVWLTGMRSRLAREALVHEVYGLLARRGALRGRPGRADPPISRVRATPGVEPNIRPLAPFFPLPATARGQGADYPGAIWAPSPNATPARQPARGRVSYVVVHDTEGSCAAALNWLDSPASGSSAHFLVCQDGTVYQLAHLRAIAWHAGNAYINQHSIGIEHEGFRDAGGYTPAQYNASAALVRWLATVYGLHIPLDRNAIFGHDNVPDGGHTDPGPYWDWSYYMSRVRGGAPYDGGDPRVAIVVAPEAMLYDCPGPSCKVVGSADWGEQFALVRTAGRWDEVDYNGHPAWVAGPAIRAGAGVRLRIGAALLPVRAAPRRSSHVMGDIMQGQVYVSRLLVHAPDRDRQGWWLIAYNHRYGFINCSYVQPLGQRLPPDCAHPSAMQAPSPAWRLTSTRTSTGIFSNNFDRQRMGALVTGPGANQYTGTSGSSRLSVENTTANSAPAALAVALSGGGSYYTYKQYSRGYTTHDLQFSVQLGSDVSLGSSGDYLVLAQTVPSTSSNAGKVNIILTQDRHIRLDYFDSFGTQRSLYGTTYLVSLGSWHSIELSERVGAGTGSLTLRVDGSTAVNSDDLDTGSQRVTWFAVGDEFTTGDAATTGHLYVDDVTTTGSSSPPLATSTSANTPANTPVPSTATLP